MAWKLSTFDNITIPEASPELAVGGPPSLMASISLPHGQMFDAYQSDVLPIAFPYELAYHTAIVPGMQVAPGSSVNSRVVESLNFIKAKRGKRGILVRVLDDGGSQYCYARLKQVSSTRTTENGTNYILIDMLFEIQSLWFSSANDMMLDEGSTLDAGDTLSGSITVYGAASGDTHTLTNAGNAATNNLTIIMIPETIGTGDTITNITFNVAGKSLFTWSGELGASNTLTINCAARTVTLDGVGAYTYFSISSTGHHINDWIRLEPGTTDIVVSWEVNYAGSPTPATCAIRFEFLDAWE